MSGPPSQKLLFTITMNVNTVAVAVTAFLTVLDGGMPLLKTQVEAGMREARSKPLTPHEPLPGRLPIFALRGGVVMPGGSMPLRVGRPETVSLVKSVGVGGLLVALPLRQPDVAHPSPEAFFRTGCFARIVSIEKHDGDLLVVLQGLRRVHVSDIVDGKAVLQEDPDEPSASPQEAADLVALYRNTMQRPAIASEAEWEDFLRRVERLSPEDQTFAIASNLNLPFADQQRLFELTNPHVRITQLRMILERMHGPVPGR